MKTKTLFKILPIVLIASAVLFLLEKQGKDASQSRKDYESFLSQEYDKLPHFSDEELESMEGPTQPDLAAMQDHLMTLDPALGYVPHDRLKKAYKEVQAMQGKDRHGSLPLEWENVPVEMGGRSRTMMWDPNDADGNKVWAGGVTGGLWYNDDITDSDSAWHAVDDFWGSLSLSSLAYDPVDPMVFYAGTGESFTALVTYRESSGLGNGIMKSVDGGASWEQLSSSSDFMYVNDIEVREENGAGVIYAAVASGIYQGEAHQSMPSDGLYRSDDGGANWEQVLPVIPGEDTPFTPATIKIAANGRIFVGTMPNIDGQGGACILYSDQGRPGSWTLFDDYKTIIENNTTYYLPGRVIMAPAPSDASVVYAIIGAGYISGHPYYKGRYILKSTDNGVNWESINKPNSGDWANLAWHALIGAVDPNDPNTLFVGGLDVYRTSNSGGQWRHVSDWSLMYYGGGDEYVHADQHDQAYKPGSSSEMIFSSDGGIFYTSSADQSYPAFEERNKDYNSLQFYTCDINPMEGFDTYIGGLQDNGSLYYQGNPLGINDMVDGGDGAYCFFDDDQPMYFMTSVYYNRYTVFINGNQSNYLDYYSGVFINPADYDYRMNTLYANAVDFFGSSNNDKILRVTNVLSNDNGTYMDLNTGSDVYFSHIRYSPYSTESSATVFVGSNSGRLFRLNNAQAVPAVTEIGSDDFPNGSISCLAIGGSEDTLLATFSNYGIPSVWQSYDGGNTWRNVEGNLPDIPVRWALYHPENALHALIATELGVWSTDDLSQEIVEWVPDNDGLANVRVDMLQMREADLTVLAATHGRGLFTTNYELDPQTSLPEMESNELHIYPNPSSGMFTVEIPSALANDYRIIISSANAAVVYDKTFSKIQAGKQLSIDLGDVAKGLYTLSINSAGDVFSTPLIIQ